MFEKKILKQYGAINKQIAKGELLFMEGDVAVFFYQIEKGRVKMNNYNDKGQETIQGIFDSGQSFGEPALLGDFPFPANAEAIEPTELICLEKTRFLNLLKEKPQYSIQLLKTLSNRLRFKAMLSKEVKGFDAEHRIMTLLQYLKSQSSTQEVYHVDITRQTIANLTGLRVETVIRTIKQLKEKNQLITKERKLYL